MKQYKDITGQSGVTAYSIAAESISVEFNHQSVYLYSYTNPGKKNVERMKDLAEAGKGLSTYISRYVKDRYETRIK